MVDQPVLLWLPPWTRLTMETTPNDHHCDSSCSLSNKLVRGAQHIETKEWERGGREGSRLSSTVRWGFICICSSSIHPLFSSALCSSVDSPLLLPSVSDVSASSPQIMNYLMFLSSEQIISPKYSDWKCRFPLFHLFQSSVDHKTLIRLNEKF